MNSEIPPDLKLRAARHAALSDVSRLAIVDGLALTDLSPGEVARMLDAPSNLVAHHVRVLREAGLVTQVRSQGDARRTYLQLVPSAVADLVVPARTVAPRVVFVCRQNSARSQLAAALWRQHSRVPAASAGTHPAGRVHPGAIAAARRHRLAMPRPATHHLADVLTDDDLLVALCDEAHEELSDRATGTLRLHWSVPDPVRVGTPEAFDAAYDLIADRVVRTATALTTQEAAR